MRAGMKGMPVFAIRRALAAIILVDAIFWAVQIYTAEIARRPEPVFQPYDPLVLPGRLPFHAFVTPVWAVPAMLGVCLLGVALSAVIWPRGTARTPAASMGDFWSARALRAHV